MEEQLLQIWADVLSLEPVEIGMEDNLFECKNLPLILKIVSLEV
jgi:hypothetical protein